MVGQINRGSARGELIYELSKDKHNTVFVEIGTWNGAGSTRCFMDAILERPDDSILYSIESCTIRYEQATNYWKFKLLPYKKPKLSLLLGRIIESSQVSTPKEVIESGLTPQHPDWKKWHEADIATYSECPNIYSELPLDIDVLLLDGGEFCSYAEWEKLRSRTKIVLLDDTNVFKNHRVKEELSQSKEWTLLADCSNENNNGFLAYKKIELE
tara:strand:+ start:2673 stop:3311 length:639 start_codon:yes stop_codon:yes gene_type:complete